MSFDRERLPDAVSYFEGEGLRLIGPGRWKTARCNFHGGSDSMRINVESGGWRCMACDEKGGDVLAFAMRRHGLEFIEAAKTLGAWIDDGKPQRTEGRPRTLSPRSAMEVIAHELLVLFVIVSDARQGLLPNDADWMRFLAGAGRIERLVSEYRT